MCGLEGGAGVPGVRGLAAVARPVSSLWGLPLAAEKVSVIYEERYTRTHRGELRVLRRPKMRWGKTKGTISIETREEHIKCI